MWIGVVAKSPPIAGVPFISLVERKEEEEEVNPLILKSSSRNSVSSGSRILWTITFESRMILQNI